MRKHRIVAVVHEHTSAYVSIRQHTSAVSIRQHPSASVSIRHAQAPNSRWGPVADVSRCQQMSAYVSIRQPLLLEDLIGRLFARRRPVSISQHTSAYVGRPEVHYSQDAILRHGRKAVALVAKGDTCHRVGIRQDCVSNQALFARRRPAIHAKQSRVLPKATPSVCTTHNTCALKRVCARRKKVVWSVYLCVCVYVREAHIDVCVCARERDTEADTQTVDL